MLEKNCGPQVQIVFEEGNLYIFFKEVVIYEKNYKKYYPLVFFVVFVFFFFHLTTMLSLLFVFVVLLNFQPLYKAWHRV